MKSKVPWDYQIKEKILKKLVALITVQEQMARHLLNMRVILQKHCLKSEKLKSVLTNLRNARVLYGVFLRYLE